MRPRAEVANNAGREHRAAVLLACLAVVAIVAVAAHWTALSAQAVSFDDTEYLIHNPLVKNPSWGSARRLLDEVLEPSTVHGYYQPLTMISLMLDCAAGGRPDNLMPFHRTSLILHVANTILVVVLLYQLFGNPWAAACVGLLFGAHPVTVETIPWVGERKTLLAAFFALLSLIAYVRYTRAGSWWRMAVCAGLYVLALMSKPTSTPLPVCMLLLDFWPLRRLSLKSLLEKLPLIATTVVSAYITYESQRRTALTITPGQWNDPWRVPLTICHNIIFYVGHLAWPRHLSSHYPLPWPIRLSDTHVLAGVIGTAVLVPVLLISLLKTRAILTGWLFFFIMILPTMGVIGFTNVIAADKFAYLPSVGLMLPLACLIGWLWDRSRRPAREISIPVILSLTAALTFALAAGTRNYLSHWRDTVTLFTYMIEREPEAATLHFHLASALAEKGDPAGAIERYQRVVQLMPGYEEAYNNMGVQYIKLGRVDQAIAMYRKVLEIDPDHIRAMNNLANCLLQKGQAAEAEKLYRRVLELRPETATAHYNVANVLAGLGEIDTAIDLYEKALALDPCSLQSRKNLGGALLRKGRIDEAIQRYREACRQDPAYWGTVSDLAWNLTLDPNPAARNLPAAIRLAELACELTDHQRAEALGALAAACGESGQPERARSLAITAIGIADKTNQPVVAAELRRRLQKYVVGVRSTTGSEHGGQ